VKSVSPQTKVFTIFQLEQMKGLNGGLFGGVGVLFRYRTSAAGADFYCIESLFYHLAGC